MVGSIEEVKRLMLSFDADKVAERIILFIREMFEESGAQKIVIGVSGGVDSSTTLKLLVDSIGRDKVLALIMPHQDITSRKDLEDAYMVADHFGVEYYTIEIADICSLIRHRLSPFMEFDEKTYGNIIARTRMITLYAFANSMNAIVAGASDKSERIIGYFTKWGDAAADIFPIMDLYKTQVRALARHIGVPESIAEKPSSPGLWKGHLAEEELGISYEKIDAILFAMNELHMGPEQIKKIEGIEEDEVELVLRLITTSEHKRKLYYPQVQDLIVKR